MPNFKVFTGRKRETLNCLKSRNRAESRAVFKIFVPPAGIFMERGKGAGAGGGAGRNISL